MDTPAEIIEAIRHAFAGVPRGEITIHEAQCIDCWGSDAEQAQARELDTDSQWADIPDAFIEYCAEALSYFDPVSWRYHIPAYMVWALRHFKTNSSSVSNYTIYAFANLGRDEIDREFNRKLNGEKFQLLDFAQSRAVCRFLVYMAAHRDHADANQAVMALRQYWGQFDDGFSMGTAPRTIGTANVICFTPTAVQYHPTDVDKSRDEDVADEPTSGLAISRLDGDEGYFLFGCNRVWQAVADTWHSTLEAALAQAESEYPGVSAKWRHHVE